MVLGGFIPTISVTGGGTSIQVEVHPVLTGDLLEGLQQKQNSLKTIAAAISNAQSALQKVKVRINPATDTLRLTTYNLITDGSSADGFR